MSKAVLNVVAGLNSIHVTILNLTAQSLDGSLEDSHQLRKPNPWWVGVDFEYIYQLPFTGLAVP